MRSKIVERSKHREHREHREAMRSKIAKRCYRSIAKRSKHREAMLSKIAERSKHREAMGSEIEDRGAIEAFRSDRSIAKRCSRGIADDDAPGGRGRSPPRRVIIERLPMPPQSPSTTLTRQHLLSGIGLPILPALLIRKMAF
jgi:hypothetical protein